MANASDSHDHVRGSQEIGEQESTFALFNGMTKWGSLITAVLVLFFTLWFRPGGDILQAFGGALVLSVAGFFALRSKPAAKH